MNVRLTKLLSKNPETPTLPPAAKKRYAIFKDHDITYSVADGYFLIMRMASAEPANMKWRKFHFSKKNLNH